MALCPASQGGKFPRRQWRYAGGVYAKEGNAYKPPRHQDGNPGTHALREKQVPDPTDIQALREYDESKKGRDFDELACDVTQIALRHRAAMRAAGAR